MSLISDSSFFLDSAPLIYAGMHNSIWLIYLLWHSIKDKKIDEYIRAVIDSAKGMPVVLVVFIIS